MTLITVQDGKIVLRDGKVGTEQACCCTSSFGCYCDIGRDTTLITEDYFTEQDAQDALDEANAEAEAAVAYLAENGWCDAKITETGFIEQFQIDIGFLLDVWRVHFARFTAGCCGSTEPGDPVFSTVRYGGEDVCIDDGSNILCGPYTQEQCDADPCCIGQVGPEPCIGEPVFVDEEFPRFGCKEEEDAPP